MCIRVLMLCLVLALGVGPAAADQSGGRRVALVVGNGAYRSVNQLANPTNDARLLAKTLRASGFVLVGGGAQLDLDKAHFDQAVAEFGRAIEGADVALFYYAGHGLQVGGTNYLVPVSANPTRVQDLDFQMVSADIVLRQMSSAGTKLNIVILDACRNNPFEGRGLRAMSGGLAEMRAPEGTLISYATQPGAVALDGDQKDSPFSLALVDAMRQPGLDLLRLFNRVGLAVKRSTGGAQQPWLASSPLDGDFYFAGAAPAPADAKPAAQPAPATTASLAAPAADPAATRAKPPSAPAPTPAPASAVAVAASGGFRCPRAGTVWITTSRIEAEGTDSGNPHVCLVKSNTLDHEQLFNYYSHSLLGNDIGSADRALTRLFLGEANPVSFTVTRHRGLDDQIFEVTWRAAGREELVIGGAQVNAMVFQVDVQAQGGAVLHTQSTLWYDPASGVYLKEVTKILNSDFNKLWSAWAHDFSAPNGWTATSLTLPAGG
jgi:uncharacterized caspase-like protein